MVDSNMIVPYQDPPYSPSSDIQRFLENIDDSIFAEQQQNEPLDQFYPLPTSNCPPFFDQLDSGPPNRDEGDQENVSSGYENMIPLPVWPPEPVQFNCTCCLVLREINHSNGFQITKLEIHGRLGLISHAILEIQSETDGFPLIREFNMIDFMKKSISDVREFLTKYCQDRERAGFVIIEDPLSVFYDALCVGLNSMEVFRENPDENPSDFHQQPDSNQEPGGAAEGEVRPSKRRKTREGKPTKRRNLSEQRRRSASLTLDDMKVHFHLPLEKAGEVMEICPTVLKKKCRMFGVARWPSRKVQKTENEITKLKRRMLERKGRGTQNVKAKIDKLLQEKSQYAFDKAI